MNLTVLVEFSAGCLLNQAILEAVKFAKRNKCFVKFDFNGVPMIVRDIGANDAATVLLYTEIYQAGLRAKHGGETEVGHE